MKRETLRFGKGFRISLRNDRSQAAQMVLSPGEVEGGADNRHRGADQWLFVVDGTGSATVDRQRVALKPGTLLLIERGESHEIRATGATPLRTVNIYVPPAYTENGDPLPPGKP